MGQADHFYKAIAFHHSNCFGKRNVRRQQHDAKVRSDKRHRIFLGSREMSKKLRVTGKTVTAEKERAFVDRRRSDRIDVSGCAQLDRCFDVTSRSFTRSARLDAWLDGTTDVVEMVDDGFGEIFGKRLSGTNDVVTGLQIKS